VPDRTPPPSHQDDLLLQQLRSFLGIVDDAAVTLALTRQTG